MKLKELYLTVDMVGFWHNSFDNSMLYTLAQNIMPKDAPDYGVAEIYVFHVLDTNNNITTDAIAVSFKQDEENIILGYKTHRFKLLSANRYEICFANDFATYSLKRPPNHVLNQGI